MTDVVIFDLETVPREDAGKPRFDESAVKTGNAGADKKAEKMAKAKAEFDDKLIKKMSLDGALNKVISITAHRVNGLGVVIGTFTAFNEKNDSKIILDFINWVGGDTLCGWNIKGFDIPVLWKRSVLSGSAALNTLKYLYLTKKYGDGCVDLMQVWNNYDFGSMAACCKSLGIPVKTVMNGADVYQYYVDGRYDEIQKYNLEDVNCCLEIYRKLYCY